MASFVDVILPLPLHGKFTYSLPEELRGKVAVGMRAYVPFGRRKFFTGIIDEIHDRKPDDYETKPVTALLDDFSPTIIYPQRKLWEWLADYYLCTVGEVYKAAVPSGMKVESETYVTLNKDYEGEARFTPREAEIVVMLQGEKRVRLDELSRRMKEKRIGPAVNRLMERGVIEIAEKAVERYHALKEKCIRLTIPRGDNDALHEFFDRVTRSARQQRALVGYLDLSKWLYAGHDVQEVAKKELIEKTDTNPGIIRALVNKGIFEEYTKTTNRFSPTVRESDLTPLPELNAPQQTALHSIRASMRQHGVTLLHGITGSGKTEIYSHLIREALQGGKQALMLVPEISLTTQLTDRLKRIFGDSMLVYHSKFSDSERVDIWQRMLRASEPLLILGVRSSVFLPFRSLGLVIVDEEHDSSYKQQDPAPRYNGRDAAILLASMHGAKALLGSATPAIETYYKATTGKYGLVELTERFEGAALPNVRVVDMREQRKKRLAKGILSTPLRLSMHRALEDGKQGLLFQNRRGFAPYVICSECGWTPKCIHCDVSPVYHKSINKLRCHYCGYQEEPPAVCPACGQNTVEVYGYGTERIAEEVHQEFEGYRVARMDLDTTRNKDSYQEIIEEFARHETDILVGTQMVTKGLDFGNVTSVGVLNADSLLNFPDFRSSERAFNVLEQVAGRAGRRKDSMGEVIIQTTDPASNTLRHVINHDYKAYYTETLEDRRRYGYPPFTKIINIYIKNKDERTVDSLATGYTLSLRNIFGNRVLGPEKPFVSRVATWYVRKIMLKVEAGASMKKVKGLLRDVWLSFARDSRMKSSQLYYDVDPL